MREPAGVTHSRVEGWVGRQGPSASQHHRPSSGSVGTSAIGRKIPFPCPLHKLILGEEETCFIFIAEVSCGGKDLSLPPIFPASHQLLSPRSGHGLGQGTVRPACTPGPHLPQKTLPLAVAAGVGPCDITQQAGAPSLLLGMEKRGAGVGALGEDEEESY